MELQEFSTYLQDLKYHKKYKDLLVTSAFEDEETSSFLLSRGLKKEYFSDLNVDIYSFSGIIDGVDFKKSVLIPLKINDLIIGVQVREIHDKKFRIFLNNNYHKVWVAGTINKNESLYVTESIFDAVSLYALTGYKNVATSLGLTLHPDLLEYDVKLCFDFDESGIIGAKRIVEKHRVGLLQVQVLDDIDLSGIKDLNDILKLGLSIDTIPLNHIGAKRFLNRF